MNNQTVTLLRVDTGEPFVLQAQMIPNGDGSVSFALPQGGYAGQEPLQYGVRHDGPNTQQYQRALVLGTVATFQTRPEDPPMVYLLGIGQVFPS